MFSNKLLLGDYIVVDHTKGKIIDITFLNVVLLDEEGDTHFIPNTVMLSQPIINNSRVQYKKSFLDFDVDNLLGLNTHYFQERLEVAMAPFKEYIEPNSFTIKPKKIESDNIKYRLIFHIKNEEIFRDKTIKKTLLDAIINIITEHYKDVRKYAQN
jgi:small-conductance mechanosensitive channel